MWISKVGSLVTHLSQTHLVKMDSAPRSWLDNSYTGTNRQWVDSYSRIETSVIERHCCRLPVMGEVDLPACCHGDVTWGHFNLVCETELCLRQRSCCGMGWLDTPTAAKCRTKGTISGAINDTELSLPESQRVRWEQEERATDRTDENER